MNVSENGWWLLARLAVHHEYNRRLRVGKQDPLWGAELNDVDRLEVARLSLALSHARSLARYPAGSPVRRAHERGEL